MKPLVAFVISLPRSGSTLLGHFLGAGTGVLYTGEIPAPLKKGRPFRCRFCDERPCPVWGSVLSQPFVERCYRSQLRAGRSSLRKRIAEVWGRSLGDYERPAAMFEKLFTSHLSPRVIIDTSKHLTWIDWNRESRVYHTKYIFLHRDLRGVMASMQRSRRQPAKEVGARIRNSVRQLQAYVRKLPDDSVLTLQYEQLVAQPVRTGDRLCQFLSMPFEQALLNYQQHPSHVIGGNMRPVRQCQKVVAAGNSTDGSVAIKIDDRWKHELTKNDLVEFERTAGNCNRELGYV